MKSVWIIVVAVSATLANSQSLPRLEGIGDELTNNSFIPYDNIVEGYISLKCVTNNKNCCTNSNVGNWRDERGRTVHQGEDGATCLYVTREGSEINLNRKTDCIPDTSGL